MICLDAPSGSIDMSSDLSNPIFYDAETARMWLEARVWPQAPVCCHCKAENRSILMQGKTTRTGLYQCNACRQTFTVTVGTLYEGSKVPLHTWLTVTFLVMSSKKGVSALQISRIVGRSNKSVWFLCHRIRESFCNAGADQFGGQNCTVEAHETFVSSGTSDPAMRKPAPKKSYVPD